MTNTPARPSGKLDPDETIRLATFRVGTETFALDIMRIREIVRPLPVTPVPRAPFAVVGAFNLRGRVLALYDLRERFGQSVPAESTTEARYLIVRVERRTIGLLVDRVNDVVSVRRKDLRFGALEGEAGEAFVGVVNVDDKLVLLLNVHRLLRSEDAVVLDNLPEVSSTGAAPARSES